MTHLAETVHINTSFVSIDYSAAPTQPLDMDCSPDALEMGCSRDALDMGCSTDALDMGCSPDISHPLFVGDVNQPALILPWQQQSADQEYTSLPWQQQLTWEQTEIVDIIGEDCLYLANLITFMLRYTNIL